MLICDTHADTLFALSQEGCDAQTLHITPERLMSPGVTRVQVLALWTGPTGLKGDDADLIDRELRALEGLKACGCRQIRDIDEAVAAQPNVMLSIEGGEAFHSGVEAVDTYADLGVRIAALCWNNPNLLGVPASVSAEGGLTDFGRDVVRRMNQRRMAVDVSHANEPTMLECVRVSRAPVMASHSCARALCDHRRNLTDAQLRELFESGGYVGVNFYPAFLNGTESASVDDVIRHIERMLALGGEGKIGFGSDLDGIESVPAGLENAACLPAFAGRLIGLFGPDVARGIAGENLRAYLARVDAAAQ